jgi:hypothetical protein
MGRRRGSVRAYFWACPTWLPPHFVVMVASDRIIWHIWGQMNSLTHSEAELQVLAELAEAEDLQARAEQFEADRRHIVRGTLTRAREATGPIGLNW